MIWWERNESPLELFNSRRKVFPSSAWAMDFCKRSKAVAGRSDVNEAAAQMAPNV